MASPLSHADRNERSEETADVDEHVEYLEARFALVAELLVVVHLTHERLQVALEQTVTECDYQQAQTRKRQIQTLAGHGCGRGNCDNQVTDRHDDQAPHDSALVVLGLIGDDTADQRKQIDRGIEARVDVTRRLLVEPELGRDEERQNSHHDVEAEAFAHVGQSGGDQTFWLFKHSFLSIF